MNNSEKTTLKYNTIDEAIAALAAGQVIIVVDEADRENEGDFVCAAENITAETVDFMLRHGRGVLCAPMTEDTADRLQLFPIVPSDNNTAPNRTHFLTPVDHIDSGSGVSTENRARTLRALANPNGQSEYFVRPGHINPLLSKTGGVLRRAGHTEATIDLMNMAGLQPVGVLIEILSQDGHEMADSRELQELSDKFELPIISTSALIRHRRTREQLINRVAEVSIPTKDYQNPTIIAYQVDHEDQEPMAMVWGDLSTIEAPLVRMHSSCFTGDVLDSLRCDCGDQLHMAMQMICDEGAGAIVYLPQEGRGIGLVAKLRAYELQDQGYDTVEANHKLGFKADPRDYMIGVQILKDLGLDKIRLLTNNPKKTESFEKMFDLSVVEQVPIIAEPIKQRERYMATKRDKMGHVLPTSETEH